LIVNAVVKNMRSGEAIEIPLHIDGGCDIAKLLLLPDDIISLNLSRKPFITDGIKVDGNKISLAEYEQQVVVELKTDAGEVWSSSIKPSVLGVPLTRNSEVLSIPVVDGVSVVDENCRILGIGGLIQLGVKYDILLHKLVRAHYKI